MREEQAIEAERGSEGDEDHLDRKLSQLVDEVRVALPGVQVLFAFLLIAPFNQGWRQTSGYERKVYVVALMCAAGASILLMATSAFHRHRFPRLARETAEDKREVIAAQYRLAVGGLIALSLPCALLCSWCSRLRCRDSRRARALGRPGVCGGSGTACRYCDDRRDASVGFRTAVLALVGQRAFELPLVHLRPAADTGLAGFVVELPVRSTALPRMGPEPSRRSKRYRAPTNGSPSRILPSGPAPC